MKDSAGRRFRVWGSEFRGLGGLEVHINLGVGKLAIAGVTVLRDGIPGFPSSGEVVVRFWCRTVPLAPKGSLAFEGILNSAPALLEAVSNTAETSSDPMIEDPMSLPAG